MTYFLLVLIAKKRKPSKDSSRKFCKFVFLPTNFLLTIRNFYFYKLKTKLRIVLFKKTEDLNLKWAKIIEFVCLSNNNNFWSQNWVLMFLIGEELKSAKHTIWNPYAIQAAPSYLGYLKLKPHLIHRFLSLFQRRTISISNFKQFHWFGSYYYKSIWESVKQKKTVGASNRKRFGVVEIRHVNGLVAISRD